MYRSGQYFYHYHSAIVTLALDVLSILQLFRETKESEIQNLLRAKQELENRLSKFAFGCQAGDDSDSHSRHGLGDLGLFISM